MITQIKLPTFLLLQLSKTSCKIGLISLNLPLSASLDRIKFVQLYQGISVTSP